MDEGSAGGLYLFCAGGPDTPHPGPELAPFGGGRIEILSLPPLVLWTQSLPRAPERTPSAVVAHHRVVSVAWKGASALAPMRFGQWFRDRESLVRALEPRVEALVDTLERVRGAGEHAVRIAEAREAPAPAVGPRDGTSEGRTPHEPAVAPPPDAPGRAHMERLAEKARERRAREAHGREIAAALAEAVAVHVRDERVSPLEGDGLVSVAHLVPADRDEAYVAAVEAFASANPGLRVVRAGPWPPYSFVA